MGQQGRPNQGPFPGQPGNQQPGAFPGQHQQQNGVPPQHQQQGGFPGQHQQYPGKILNQVKGSVTKNNHLMKWFFQFHFISHNPGMPRTDENPTQAKEAGKFHHFLFIYHFPRFKFFL